MTRSPSLREAMGVGLLVAFAACPGQGEEAGGPGASALQPTGGVAAAVMRAVQMREFGGPEVLRVEEVARPVPAE